MGTKHNRCCCCPNCTFRVDLCCPCVCPAICVTSTPDNYADCDPESVEIDWDNAINGYQGTLAGHDLYYYIERDPPPPGKDRGPCKFKLRSNSLGYPEGYEYEWEIPCDPYEEIPCTTCLALETELSVPAEEYDECSGGLLTTECVRWVTPTNCDNCHCLCECLCAFVTKDGVSYSGKLCWDEYEQNRWIGTVTGLDQYGAEVSLDMRVEMDRWGDVCDPDTDDDCDPYDDSCAINAYVEGDAGDIAGNWQKMTEPCELRAVTYSWTIERDPGTDEDDIEINVRCATCNEDCEPYVEMPCCDNPWPKRLTLSFTSNINDIACVCEYPQSFPLNWTASEGWRVTGVWNCPNSGLVMADCLPHGVFLAMAPSSCDIVVMWDYGIPPEDPYNIATWGNLPYSLSPSFGNLLVITDDTTLAAAMAQLEAELEAAGRKFDTHGVLVCDPPMIWIRKREYDTEEWIGVDIIVTA